MKIKSLVTISLLLCLIIAGVAQIPKKMDNYDSQWKAIEKLEKADKPQSTIKLVDELLSKAKKEGDFGQQLKALMKRANLRASINSDNQYLIFEELNNLLSEAKTEEDKAIVHSVLAVAYNSSYSNDRWMIDSRTKLKDYVPEDMAEWSSNIYLDKIKAHFDKSIENRDALLKTSPDKYNAIIEKGKDSKEYYPTLYDFLMMQGLPLLDNNEQTVMTQNKAISDVDLFLASDSEIDSKALNYYKVYLKDLSERKLENTFVLTELSRLNFLERQISNFPILECLTKLETKYAEKEISIDIIAQIVRAIANKEEYDYRNENEDVDNRKARYDWLNKGINRFPDSKKTANLRNALKELESSFARVNVESVYYPTKEKTIKVKYRNQKSINIKVKDKKGVIVLNKDYALNNPTTYLTQDTTIVLPLNKIGEYNLLLDGSNNEEQGFRISNLLSLSRTFDNKAYEFFVFDRVSGKPLEGLAIELSQSESWNGKKIVLKTVQTGKLGLAQYTKETDDSRKYYFYRVLDNKNGDATAYSSLPGNYGSASDRENVQENINIFTDRSIYRPGQTVYFKVVTYTTQDLKSNLQTNKLLKIRLHDSNGEIVETKELKTNEFGSVSGEFILPKSALNGNFSIQTDDRGYANLRVEEYKRPTFEVKFDKNEDTYSFGDKIKLKGLAETYSGVKLQNATVKYTIQRQSLFFRMSGDDMIIDSGEAKTSYDGSFVVDFQIPEKTKNKRKLRYWYPETYVYSVIADVRDENGETQSTTTYIYVGEVSMQLKLSLADKFSKERGQNITINAQNLSGSSIDASGDINICKINKTDTVSISQMSFKTGEQKLLEEKLKGLSSGEYQIVLTSKDDKGRKIEEKQSVIIYSTKDKQPPVETNRWIIVNDSIVGGNLSSTFSLSNPAKISIGASAKDVTVIYEIISENNKLLSRESFKLSNSIKNITIPYKAEYNNSITVNFTYVIDEKVYQESIRFDKETEKKGLQLKFEVFRDRLRPGQQEEWRISLLDPKNQPAAAEVLASMYDRSIDQIQQTQDWYLNPNPYFYYSVSTLNQDESRGGRMELYKYSDRSREKGFSYSFDSFIPFYFGYRNMVNQKMIMGSTDLVLEESSVQYAPAAPTLRSSKNRVKQDTLDEVAAVEDLALSGVVAGGGATEVQIRQNFNETAFFYPHLRTNEKGEVVISFLVPESNTSWKFRALAFDKLLNVGSLDAISVSKKELMVTPNAPRFFREGDKTSISTKVSNLSDQKISGDVKIEFFDPLTNKLVDLKVKEQSQKFSIDKDASTSIQWSFDVPQGIDMIGYRIIAKNETFSDGEQHVLSVLPNRILVTESLPIDVVKAGTKDFSFDRFLNSKSTTADNYKLTFEYAANPAWYAIQALPVLSNPTNDNSVNWFASYYANTLASHILKKYPKVEAMIKTWQQSGESAETLASKLQKNDELKSVLLEETPWVMEAKNETEQMQRLALLFDLNRTASVQNSAIDKLAELQTSSGGWSWYKSNYPSRSITQYILYGFTSLVELNAVEYPQKVKEMQMAALKYIDKAILDDYNDLKKIKNWEKTNSLSTNQLEYLYVRSSYRDIPIDKETREAERFYTNVAEQNWQKLSLYERSILLVLTKKNGNKNLAQKIFESLKEYATVKENLGMYWDAKNTGNYRCFVSSSSVPVHVFLMKAFEEMNASTEDMNLMKQWLLSQKRTQLWESTHATIDAISILLRTGDDWFGVENGDRIKLGKYELDMSNAEKGTGYVKQSWAKSEIKSDLGRISIDKKGTTPSFGAMYWQYYEDLDKIDQQKTGLAVDKKLFKETVSNTGKGLLEVSSKDKLNVGDKVVVRLTVRADRDYDFVHLKDMRAACFEPTQSKSGYQWSRELSYYQETKDASTNFFIDYLPKGTYVLEYSVYVNREGNYSNGISTIQCLYAPEFTSHTSGIRVEVVK